MAAYEPAESDFDEVSDYAYTVDSDASLDTLQDMMRRFTLDCRPDYTLKIRHRLGSLVLGADVTQSTVNRALSGAVLVKPASSSQLWRRLRLDAGSGQLSVKSRKLHWWLLAADLEGHANLRTRVTDFSFRVTTKWGSRHGQLRNKRRLGLGPHAEARAHWGLDYHLPELAGSLTTGQAAAGRQVDADLGYAHLCIPKLELALWPGCRRPGADEPAEGAPSSSGEEEVEEPGPAPRAAARPAPAPAPGVAPPVACASGSGKGSPTRGMPDLREVQAHLTSLVGGWAGGARQGAQDLQRRVQGASQALRERASPAGSSCSAAAVKQ